MCRVEKETVTSLMLFIPLLYWTSKKQVRWKHLANVASSWKKNSRYGRPKVVKRNITIPIG